MGKKARLKAATTAPRPTETGEIPAVGGREPCPCGSGRRYKACHGRLVSRAATASFVARPFGGLPGEADWVALREFVPAATAPLRLAPGRLLGDYGPLSDRPVTVVTVLPMAAPALSREDGNVLIGLSTQTGGGDPSRSLATALLAALATEPGQPVDLAGASARASGGSGADAGAGARLQDLLHPDAQLEVTLHDSFDFWLADADHADGGEVAALLEQANTAIFPTSRLTSVPAAYWCEIGERRYLRWVLPYDENPLLDALARLHAAGESGIGDGSRLLGTFRAYGLLVPVWELPVDRTADQLEDPLTDIDKRLTEALAVEAPLTSAERGARNGLRARQLTIR